MTQEKNFLYFSNWFFLGIRGRVHSIERESVRQNVDRRRLFFTIVACNRAGYLVGFFFVFVFLTNSNFNFRREFLVVFCFSYTATLPNVAQVSAGA